MAAVEEMEPRFINELLSQDTDHNSYFVVGGQTTGNAERMGVVAAMVMAHSLVLRSALSMQDSELDEKWDTPLVFIKPDTFRIILKYTYGYRVIKQLPFPCIVELLTAAHKLEISLLKEETVELVGSLLEPDNICYILQEPACLLIQPICKQVTDMIQKSLPSMIKRNHIIDPVSPEWMFYIVNQASQSISDRELWKVVIRWAKNIYNKDKDTFSKSGLNMITEYIIPHVKLTKLCILDIIKAVQKLSSTLEYFDKEDADLISFGHVVPSGLTKRKVMLCSNTSINGTFKHEMFWVEKIHNTSHLSQPMLAKSSEIYITTYDKSFELYSVVCSGRSPSFEPLIQNGDYQTCSGGMQVYNPKCEVKVKLYNKSTREFDDVSKILFKKNVIPDEEFQISLYKKGKSFDLQCNSLYKVELSFFSPHPLWKTMLVEEDIPAAITISASLDLKVESKTHVKYVIYRDVC